MRKAIFHASLCLAVIGGVLGAAANALASQAFSVTSPDGKLSLTLELKRNPQPYLPGERIYYRLSYNGRAILRDSPLGLDFKDAPPLDHNLEVLGTRRASENSTWENRFGARRIIPNHYNQLTVSLQEQEAPRRRLGLIFRAYDEGVAFRYFLPRQPALKDFTIAEEDTGFYFPPKTSAYALELDSYTTPYEAPYQHIGLDRIKPTSLVGLPLLVEIPHGPWVGLLEADLSNYGGMYLGGVRGIPDALMSKVSPVANPDIWAMSTYTDAAATGKDFSRLNQLARQKIILSPRDRGRKLGYDRLVLGATPFSTPWRVLMVSPNPGGLIEHNYLILDLNPPCALADTSWIHPGKAAWDWWSGTLTGKVNFKPGMNTATMKYYVDFAAAHHLEYMLIDGGWSPFNDITRPIPGLNIQEITSYAKSKGVKVVIWALWTAVQEQMDKAFPLYQKWGIAGVKIDFMDRDGQEMVYFYHHVVQTAAKYHLIIDFHGAYKPTGIRRTYPNLISREALQGLEYDKSTYRITPAYDATVPFVRMLAGPMDYTPGAFRNATRAEFKPQFIAPMSQGTRAHQLAMLVIAQTPFQSLADDPGAYEHQPAFEFIEKVPTVWDQTKVLDGFPGKYLTIVRQHGKNWYLGSITNWDARDLDVPLSFLGAGKFQARIFADGPDADTIATQAKIFNENVNDHGTLKIHLASGGGAAVIFTPEH